MQLVYYVDKFCAAEARHSDPQQVVGVNKSRERRKAGVKCSSVTVRQLQWGSVDHLDPTVLKRLAEAA
jgi:hypothetical protein